MISKKNNKEELLHGAADTTDSAEEMQDGYQADFDESFESDVPDELEELPDEWQDSDDEEYYDDEEYDDDEECYDDDYEYEDYEYEESDDERISELVNGLNDTFTESDDEETDNVTTFDLSQLDDDPSDGDSEEKIARKKQSELDALADLMRKQSIEVDPSVEEVESDDDVKIFPSKIIGIIADGEVKIEDQPETPEIERTSVFEPLKPAPSDAGTTPSAGDYSQGTAAPRKKSRYGLFKGLAQIAALLAVIIGISWLLSVAAFPARGENNASSAETYNYSTTSTIIKQFDDDSDPEPVVVPDFTVDKLIFGDTGDMVVAVQKTLASLGYLAPNKVSGTYDNATKSAVAQFQKANSLDVTGEVNRTTYMLIFDSKAVAPTTRTTALPSSTETETSTTQTESKTETQTTTTQTESQTTTQTESQTETQSTSRTTTRTTVKTEPKTTRPIIRITTRTTPRVTIRVTSRTTTNASIRTTVITTPRTTVTTTTKATTASTTSTTTTTVTTTTTTTVLTTTSTTKATSPQETEPTSSSSADTTKPTKPTSSTQESTSPSEPETTERTKTTTAAEPEPPQSTTEAGANTEPTHGSDSDD